MIVVVLYNSIFFLRCTGVMLRGQEGNSIVAQSHGGKSLLLAQRQYSFTEF